MSTLIVKGNRHLSGRVNVSGSKNAALPIMFATLVTGGVSIIRGVPRIADVDVAAEILTDLGADVRWDGGSLVIDTSRAKYKKPREELIKKIRASSYLLGAALSRFGETCVQDFGGCNFDKRPIDMHVCVMKSMGAAECDGRFTARTLVGTDIAFKTVSVGATVNAILLGVRAKGKTSIYGYAREPHVLSLVDFLCRAGADIKVFTDRIEISESELQGAQTTVIPDMIEAGTYVSLSMMIQSPFSICGIDPTHLSSYFATLSLAGADFAFSHDSVRVISNVNRAVNIIAEPYPAFPTDLQPITAPLLAAYYGGEISDKVWPRRFGYLADLAKFGIMSEIEYGRALIRKSCIAASSASAPDLRGGAALLLCALLAKGESRIENSEIIRRGYHDVVGKLRLLGAEIEEI